MKLSLEILFDLKREKELSRFLSYQSIFCFRAKRRAILLADALLDKDGDFHQLEEMIALLQNEGHILGELSTNDSIITERFFRVLQEILTNSSLRKQLKSFGMPLHDVGVEEMIRLTLNVEEELTNRHVIWAVFSSLLCPLRQSVGSCFATAPAILIHEEQMEQFLKDMQDCLSKGELSRVVGGVESTVPISPSPGIGELKKECNPNHPGFQRALVGLGFSLKVDNKGSYLEVLEKLLLEKFDLMKKDLLISRKRQSAKLERLEMMESLFRIGKWLMISFSDHLLLKMWEFTIASFVDVKVEFSKWNLYSSLGLQSSEEGGIGEYIYSYLEKKLNETNEKLDHFQGEYEVAFDQVNTARHLLKNVTSEAEGRRLRAEYQAKLYHMDACLEMRDKYSQDSHQIAHFFTFLIENTIEKFQEYFQEIYDAEMQEVQISQYDDSPAGFRLVYKHGRAHTKSWTYIRSKEEYIQALKDFFRSIEYSLKELCDWKGGKEEISHLTTGILHLLDTEEFLISAFIRMGKIHRMPIQTVDLNEFEKLEMKPWAYTSGGTMPTLLKTYFRREKDLSEEKRWIDNAEDLLIFLLESLKNLPPNVTDLFVKNPQRRMLITSPSHAFSLIPGEEFFRKGWENVGFTYTWVRDELVLPRRHYYNNIRLNPQEQRFLIEELIKRLPHLDGYELEKNFIPSEKSISIQELFQKIPSIHNLEGYLYEMLPLSSKKLAEEVFEKLEISLSLTSSFIGRRNLYDQILQSFSLLQPIDLHQKVADLFEEKHLSPPRPLLFADTNWSQFFFSFLVNPVNEKLELWRTDRLGFTGFPMREWDFFINGMVKENWSIFLKPNEYTFK